MKGVELSPPNPDWSVSRRPWMRTLDSFLSVNSDSPCGNFFFVRLHIVGNAFITRSLPVPFFLSDLLNELSKMI